MRSLVRDLGEALGCGAHVAELRRLWVEPFLAPRMYTLEALDALAAQGDEALLGALLPVEAGLAGFPRRDLDADGTRRFGMGQRLRGQGETVATVAVFGPDGRVLGLGSVDPEGTLVPQRLFSWAVLNTPAAVRPKH